MLIPMTDNEIRIAIAEKCGWHSAEMITKNVWVGIKCGSALTPIPHYDTDLNAMHEAWSTLDTKQRAKFTEGLAYIVLNVHNDPSQEFVFSRCSLSLFANATARQRAEAFCRALGIWKD